jgi:hypothetical protein
MKVTNRHEGVTPCWATISSGMVSEHHKASNLCPEAGGAPGLLYTWLPCSMQLVEETCSQVVVPRVPSRSSLQLLLQEEESIN